jgi:hypothetical protein
LRRDGILSINRAAFALLGSPAAVQLLYDHEARIIGLRSVPETEGLRTYRIPKKSGHTVNVRTFLQHYEIEVSQARRYPVTLVEGILEIDLNGPWEDVTPPLTLKQRQALEQQEEDTQDSHT